MVAHPVVIRGPKRFTASPAPLLLERTDARFMSNVRDELGNAAKWPDLQASVLRQTSATLKLFQPIHRTSYVALLELVCDVAGTPRLDPAKIDSAGLVIRRVRTRRDGAETEVNEGWMRGDDGSSGWFPFGERPGDSSRVFADADPDAQRRPVRSTGNAELDRRLAALTSAATRRSEQVVELFVLPARVSEATGATLLYGLVPTTSLATSQAPPAEEYEDAEVKNAAYPLFLQAKNGTPRVPFAGQELERPSAEEPDRLLVNGGERRLPILGNKVFDDYVTFLQQVVIQYDLLGQGSAAQRLRRELDRIELPLSATDASDTIPMGQHLEQAAGLLVFGAAGKVRMPTSWVRPTEKQDRAILDAVKDSMRQRLNGMNREEPQFGRQGDRYVVRAFVRVRRDDGCPPDLFWAPSTQPFEIAPWYESGPGPMPVVPLPDPFAAPGLSQFKPNVAFALPSSIVDVVRDNSPDALIKGEGRRGGGLGIAWLCGFNIPLITLCAFIVLSIFLSLFNIIFWWLAFIKICIPIPKRQT